ncbi:transcription repressor NadR [Clostridium rectalis]|uniref:transcription repressor NadR n=1 Tax=Clostridium rectalis TaxID=2040295 RepID=UPI000F642C45|nr:transcription repressor NadR [Clostridium rectalis]
MNSIDRRNYIIKMLQESDKPLKGQEFAKKFNITRQVIVKDIAILRAKGENIIATPDGYMINKNNLNSKIIAVTHNSNRIEDELKTIVKYGGVIEDVIVEHVIYGEIKAMLMIKTLYDIENFIMKIHKDKAEPLLVLTNGVHLHTILTERKEDMENIISELKTKGYLIEE